MKLYNIESKIYITSQANSNKALWDSDNFVISADNEYDAASLAISFLHNKHRVKGDKVKKIQWVNNERTIADIDYDYRVYPALGKVYRYEFKIEEIKTTGF